MKLPKNASEQARRRGDLIEMSEICTGGPTGKLIGAQPTEHQGDPIMSNCIIADASGSAESLEL
jgi:hypothetical protein